MSCFNLSESDQFLILDKLHVSNIQGTRKRCHKLLSVIGASFLASTGSTQVVKKYLEEKIYPALAVTPFLVLYVHSEVDRSKNFPRFLYFLHPGVQARIFLAAFHHLIFSPSLYKKVRYVKRVEFLWEHAWRKEMQWPLMDYNLESDHPRCSTQPSAADSAIPIFSMRCIA